MPSATTPTRRRDEPATLPIWVKPQLAALVKEAPDGPGWLHEIKFDGYRMHARLDAGRLQILTRRGNDWTPKDPAIAKVIAGLPAKNAYLDGESHFTWLGNPFQRFHSMRLCSKCLNRGEFVVVGWSDPEGTRHRIGSLLLAYYTPEGKLIYAGRAGTGMPVAELERVWQHPSTARGRKDAVVDSAATWKPIRIAAGAVASSLGAPGDGRRG